MELQIRYAACVKRGLQELFDSELGGVDFSW